MIEQGWHVVPFWAGVMMTLIVEVVIIILAIVIAAIVGALKRKPS